MALGLRPGLTIAHAQALVPELHIAEATPDEDNEGLARLATWCLRYSPLVAADRPLRSLDPEELLTRRATPQGLIL